MKIRSGFVSNSSSSSFVLATKNKHLEEVKIKIEVTLDQVGAEMLSNMNEVESYIEREMIWHNGPIKDVLDPEHVHHQEDVVNFYAKCVDLLHDGKSIIVGSVSSDGDDGVEYLLYERGFSNVDLDENTEIISDNC